MGNDPHYERLFVNLKGEESKALSEQSRVLRGWAAETVATSRRIREETAALREHIAEGRAIVRRA